MNNFKTTKDLEIEELKSQLDIANSRMKQLIAEHSEMIDNCIATLNQLVPTEAE